MSEFNAADYFTRRTNGNTATYSDNLFSNVDHLDDTTPSNVKRASVLAASARITEALSLRAAENEAAKESWSQSLTGGSDGFFGTLTNGAARAAESTTRIITNAATAPLTAKVTADTLSIPNEVRLAHQRSLAGTATDADKALLSTAIQDNTPTASDLAAVANPFLDSGQRSTPNLITWKDKIDQVVKGTQLVSDMKKSADLSRIVDRRDENATLASIVTDAGDAVPQMQGGMDSITSGFRKAINGSVVDGGTELAGGLGTLGLGAARALPSVAMNAAKNPGLVAEMAMGVAPDIALGIVAGVPGTLASTIPYGIAAFQDGLETQSKTGALADNDWLGANAIKAASLIAAETIGDRLVGGAFKGGESAAKAAAGKLVSEATDVAERTALKQALYGAGNKLGALGLAAAEGGLAEYGTEGYQTWVENSIKGEQTSAEDLLKGAAAGALAGGGMSTGLHVISGSGKNAEAKVDKNLKLTTPLTPEQQVAFDQAITTGDTTAYLDKTSEVYNPNRALEVLFNHNSLPTTTIEEKVANKTAAKQIVTDMEINVDTLKKDLELHSKSTPEDATKFANHIEGLKQKLEEVDPTDTTKIEAFNKLIGKLQEDLNGTDPTYQKTLAAEITQQERKLAGAKQQQLALQTTLRNVRPTVAPTEETTNPTDLVVPNEEAIKQGLPANPDPVSWTPDEVQKVVIRSMASHIDLDPVVATKLADNQANGLTEPQRTYLREFSAARIAQNALKDVEGVKNEVLNGSSQNRGLKQYRDWIGSNLQAGFAPVVTNYLNQLSRFAASHVAKAEALDKARIQANNTNKPVQIQSAGNGVWFVANNILEGKEQAKNGAVTVDPRSNTSLELVSEVKKESTAISSTLKELTAAYAVKFGKAPTLTNSVPLSTIEQRNQEVEQLFNPTVTNEVSSEPKTSQTQQSQPQEKTSKATTTEPVGATGTVPPVAKAEEKPTEPFFSKVFTEAVVKHVEYFKNPPADYTSKRALEIVSWAERQLVKLIESIKNTNEATETDLHNEMTDMRSSLQRLVAKGNEMVSSDVYLQEKLGPQGDATTETVSAEQNTTAETVASNNLEEAPGGSAPTETVQESKQDGKLSVFVEAAQDTSAEPSTELTAAERYKKLNLIKYFFTQVANSAKDATERPLAAVKDFLSQWKTGSINPFTYLKDLTEEEGSHPVLNAFKAKALEWQELYAAQLFPHKTSSFKYRDMMQFLITRDGKGNPDIDENLKTAMSYSAFAWIANAAGKGVFNTPKEINAILGRGDDHFVTPREYGVLGQVGMRANLVRNELGKAAIQALGLRTTPDAPKDLMPKLESAIGAHIATMLIEQGYMKETPVTDWQMEVLRGNKPTDSKRVHNFLKLARDPENKLFTEQEQIKQATKGSKGVLDKLFGVEPKSKGPSLTRIRYRQQTTKNTQQEIPAALVKEMQHQSNTPLTLRQEMWHAFNGLTESTRLLVIGLKDTDEEPTHIDTLKSSLAKNEGLIREYTHLFDFVNDTLIPSGKGLEQEFYIPRIVYKQQRTGQDSNTINTQTSKVHRHFFAQNGWSTVVKFGSATEFLLKLRIAEGLGVKTEKMLQEGALQVYAQEMAKPAIQAAVAALRKLQRVEELTASEDIAVATGVRAGGENSHTFDALVAQAAYEEALAAHTDPKIKGPDSFTSNLIGEIDGVTNGPMLSHLALGAGADVEQLMTLLNRGGFYGQKDSATQYSNWRSQSAVHDLYEATAATLNRFILQTQAPFNKDWRDAIFSFTGELVNSAGGVTKDGRSIVKTPLTALLFGSSKEKSVESMGQTFIESIYTHLEKIAGQPDDAARAAKTVKAIKNINILLDGNGRLSEGMSIEKLLEKSLNDSQLKSLESSFNAALGEAVVATLDTEFGAFLKMRNQVGATTRTTFNLYDTVFEGFKAAEVADLPLNNAKVAQPIATLSQKQEDAIRSKLAGIAPVVNTALSKQNRGPTAGLIMAKVKASLAPADSVYSSEVKVSSDVNGSGARSIYTTGGIVEQEAPSSFLPVLIHSLDSAISHTAAALGNVLNIHDAHGVGLGSFTQTAINLNHAVWTNMLQYSPAAAVSEALGNTIKGIATILADPTTPPAVLDKLRAYLKTTNLIREAANAYALAYQADSVKLDTMAQLTSIDQYPAYGGNYLVTETDIAAAVATRKLLDSKLPKEVLQAITDIQTVLKVKKTPAAQTTTTETKQEPQDPTTNWGTIGESQDKAKSDPELVQMFKTTPEMTGSELVAKLKELLGKQPKSVRNDFNKMLLDKLGKLIPESLQVRYVTAATKEDQVLGKPDKTARGWYASTNGNESGVYILGAEYLKSGVTAETVLHELLHSALSQAIEDIQGDKGIPEQKQMVAELEAIRQKALAYVSNPANNLQGMFGAAMSDVHELVSWGMTNASFQRLVLNKITIKSTTKGNSYIAASKAFIKSLVGILFSTSDKSSQAIAVTGMSALIKNVSGLLEVAAQQKDQNQVPQVLPESVVRSMASQLGPDPRTYSTQDIYKALNASTATPVSVAFNEHLEGLLSGIVNTLHGTFGSFKESLMKDQTMTPDEVFQKALADKEAPFASLSLGAGFRIGSQSAYVLEQVEVAVRYALSASEGGSTSPFYRGIQSLFNEARTTFNTPEKLYQGDWATATADEQKHTKDLHDFIFQLKPGLNGTIDTLSRFAALGLAQEDFNTMLKGVELNKAKKDKPKTLAERLHRFFEEISDWISDRITKVTASDKADVKLTKLVTQLVNIEAKQRAVLHANRASKTLRTLLDIQLHGEAFADGLTEKLKEVVNTAAKSKLVRNSGNRFLKGSIAIINQVAQGNTALMLETLTEMLDKSNKGVYGVIQGTLNELKAPIESFHKLLREVATKNEQKRKFMIAETRKSVNDGYINDGKDLTKDQRDGLTSLLRADAQSLMDDFTITELHELMTGPAKLQEAIATWKGKLSPFSKQYQMYFTNQAEAMGKGMAQGGDRGPQMLRNAVSIVRLYATGRKSTLTQAEVDSATHTVDVLGSLFALKHTTSKELLGASQALEKENARTDANGVLSMLSHHRMLQQQASATVFLDAEVLMAKGYTPDLNNPNTDIELVYLGSPEFDALNNQGFVPSEPLPLDTKDPDQQPRIMMVRKNGGVSRFVTGLYSYSGKGAKGTRTLGRNRNGNSFEGAFNLAELDRMASEQKAEVGRLFTHPIDLSSTAPVRMSPVLNDLGDISNYRYSMSSETKNRKLERDNRFDVVMGALAGQTFDKQTAPEQNEQVTQALYDQFELEYKKKPDAYEMVGPNSSDPELRELYQMMPPEAKAAIKRIWGDKNMFVRKDMLDLVFGYRKLSLRTIWDKEKRDRDMKELAFSNAVEGVLKLVGRLRGMSIQEAENYSERAQWYVLNAEDVWQALVQEAKSNIVIKSVSTLLGNEISNLSLLVTNGVSLKDIAKNRVIATKGVRQWHKDAETLFRLKTQLDSGDSKMTKAELRSRMAVVEASMKANPIKNLIDAGLSPSIVEDVTLEDSPWSYQAQLAERYKSTTDKIPTLVKDIANQAYMGKDTSAYGLLMELTQSSDFIARFTLYQHLTTRARKPLTSDQAISKASDSFINYDAPMHRALQYTDDMGITMFTKYFLRIQRPLLTLAQEHPARVLAMMGLMNVWNVDNMVLDSGALGRIGNNPFHLGALNALGSLDDLATMKAAASLYR